MLKAVAAGSGSGGTGELVASVQAATTGVLANTPTYDNGSSGVGATLTAGSNGALPAQDGITLVVADRLLVKNQAAALQNGVYTVTVVGTAGTPYVLTRATDFNSSANITYGTIVPIDAGTTLAGTAWMLTGSGAITVGVTSLNFTQINFTANVVTAAAVMTANQLVVGDDGARGIKTANATITGAYTFSGSLTLSAALTYGGVTLSNAVTGTGNMVLATSPTLTTPVLGVASSTSMEHSGTGGAGFAGFVAQSSAPSAPAGGFRAYADATGRFSWIRQSDGFTRTWDATLTESRVYTLPDASAIIAGSNIAQSWSGNQTNMVLVTPTLGVAAGTSLTLSATAQAMDIGAADTPTYIRVAGQRSFVGYDGGQAVLQGGSGKGVVLRVNSNTVGGGTAALSFDSSGVGTFSSGFSTPGSTTYTAAASGPTLKQGANGRVGTFVANGVTPVTVNNTSIAISDAIVISLNTVGGTVGAVPAIQTITAATGFTVAGTALDTSTYNYAIIKNAA